MFRVGNPPLQVVQYLSQQGLGGPTTSRLEAVKNKGAARVIEAMIARLRFSFRFIVSIVLL